MDPSNTTEPDDTTIEARLLASLAPLPDDQEQPTESVSDSTDSTPDIWYTAPASPQPIADLQELDQPDVHLTIKRHWLELRTERTRVIESLPDMSLDQKIRLRNALKYENWPARFRTYENFHGPHSNEEQFANVRLQADERVMNVLVVSSLIDLSIIASKLFPGKLEMDVNSKYSEILDRGH